jgi:hypothetical protein
MRFRGAVVSIVRLLSIVPLLAIAEIGSAASEEQASQGQAAAKASRVVVLNGDRVTLANKASIEVSADASLWRRRWCNGPNQGSPIVMVDSQELVSVLDFLEALIGSVAIERRVRSGALSADGIPAAMRDVQSKIIQRSPLAIAVDKQ